LFAGIHKIYIISTLKCRKCGEIWHENVYTIYREDFCFVDRFYGSALHDGRCAACREAHTNFADESAYLTAGNFRNEMVTIDRSKVLKMLFLYM
jgi:hypothetical protein